MQGGAQPQPGQAGRPSKQSLAAFNARIVAVGHAQAMQHVCTSTRPKELPVTSHQPSFSKAAVFDAVVKVAQVDSRLLRC